MQISVSCSGNAKDMRQLSYGYKHLYRYFVADHMFDVSNVVEGHRRLVTNCARVGRQSVERSHRHKTVEAEVARWRKNEKEGGG